jgi:hypothetical protein
VNEPVLGTTFTDNPALRWGLTATVIVGVLVAGWLKERHSAGKQQAA